MDQHKFDEIWDSLEPKPHQRVVDFKWLIDWLEKFKPKIILEIGFATGGSLKYWEQVLLNSHPNQLKDCLLIGVDNNPGQIPTWDYKNSPIDIQLVYEDSTRLESVYKVREVLQKRKIDFLFIDGGHRYSIPEKDFNNFCPFVREKGVICVADLGEPCPSHTFLQLPEPRRVDPTLCMGLWRKDSEFQVKLCSNQGENDDTYDGLIDMFRYRVPNPP